MIRGAHDFKRFLSLLNFFPLRHFVMQANLWRRKLNPGTKLVQSAPLINLQVQLPHAVHHHGTGIEVFFKLESGVLGRKNAAFFFDLAKEKKMLTVCLCV